MDAVNGAPFNEEVNMKEEPLDAVNGAPCNEEVNIKEEPLDPKVSCCTCFNQIRFLCTKSIGKPPQYI